MFGGAAYVDGTLEAFSMGEQLNRDTAVVHFEKGESHNRRSLPASEQLVLHEPVERVDLGEPRAGSGDTRAEKGEAGLQPHHFIEKYVARAL